MKAWIGRIWILGILVTLGFDLVGQDLDEEAVKAIKEGDVRSIAAYLDQHPEQAAGDPSLAKLAIRYNQQRILRLLIEYGADVNERDEKQNTPLIYAATMNNDEICKVLVDRGANPMLTNLKGKTAADLAYNYDDSRAYRYLQYMERESLSGDSVASMQDGPYIIRESDNELVMTWFEHRQGEKVTRMIEKTIWNVMGDTVVKGTGWDKNTYHVKSGYPPDSCNIKTSGEIFTVGDVHGKFRALTGLLVNNHIIDTAQNWTFGNGQLVMLGDIFDRGGSVTEVLWFLYELQIQARQAGGNVHLLLGNHEMMALTRDYRYLNDKYDYFSRYFRIEYAQLYERNTILGEWLRSQNVIMQINDYLLLHAGISPEFAALGLSYRETNERVRKFLNSEYTIVPGSVEDSILGAYGPQWYRGYGYFKNTAPEVSQQFVDDYLASNGLKKMIIGHNEQKVIQTSFNGKVISADVALDDTGMTAQGLLISGEKFFRCNADGTREPIIFPDH